MRKILSLMSLLFIAGAALTFVAPSRSQTSPAHWPEWRGPSFNGMARTGAPVEFNDTKNLKWKLEIPGRGFSTPVIWGNRMFLTTAIPTGKKGPVSPTGATHPQGGTGAGEEQRFVVLCLDRKTGKTLWERTASTAVPHEGYHRAYGSFASNSPVTDGKHLYAFFGSRGVFCFDLDGKPVWQKDLNVRMQIRNQFGEGGAPALAGNNLILNFDHEAESFIVALDKTTGKEVWRKGRDKEPSAWSTPLAIESKGRRELVVSGTGKVRSYDPQTGKVIWECAGLGLNVIPAPILQNDLVYVMSGFRDPKLMAIRLGREGDLTGTDAVAWSQTRGMSYTPSPVLHDNKIYTLTDNAMLSCFNATTGEPYYHQKRLPQPDNFKASPIGADGKLYLASESGIVTVVKMGEQFEILAQNTFADQFFISSPIVAEGELFLRSKTHLFCVSDAGRK
ncbi:MAG: PQQ-binding-like beta-propeller repeat protein [Blastocatellia bacterium]